MPCFCIIVKTKDVKCLASPKLLSKFPISVLVLLLLNNINTDPFHDLKVMVEGEGGGR